MFLVAFRVEVDVRNRFKGLDLIDREPEELWTEVPDIVQEAGIKTIPKEKKCKKAKWLSEEALQQLRKEEKQTAKEKGKDIPNYTQSSREQQGEIRKPSYVNNAKKQRKTIEWEGLQRSQENWRYQGNTSCKDRYNKGEKWQAHNKSRRY